MDQYELIISSDLGLQGQALALLALLSADVQTVELRTSEMPPEVDTYAWYNGQERCILLDVYLPFGEVEDHLYIVCGENRSSDDLFVDCWISESGGINPPTINDMPADVLDRRCLFKYGDLRESSGYILDLIQDFVDAEWSSLSWVCSECHREGLSRTDLDAGGACPKCGGPVEATGAVQVPAAADPRTWD